MAITTVLPSGVQVSIPGAYVQQSVVTDNSGLATSGVITIVGEAVQGPAWGQELDITQNFYSPDRIADVRAKYGSGPIVDAFRAIAAPTTDTSIAGAASRVYIVKTNQGGQASALLTRSGLTAWEKVRRSFLW